MPRAPKSQSGTPTGPRLVGKTTAATTTKPTAPPHAQIERRADALVLQSGGSHGHDLEDWLTAERELTEAAAGRRVTRVAGVRAKT